MSASTYGIRRDLPPFIRDQLASPPKRGEGLHNWIFRIARQLHWHRSEDEIVRLLADVLQASAVQHGEIESAVRNSKASAWKPGRSMTFASGKKWPELDPELFDRILLSGVGVADLEEASPVLVDPSTLETESTIDILFPGNPLLCCGMAVDRFETTPREGWRGRLARHQFIVPSPMLRPTGTTKEGKISVRCLDNTGPLRFLVVEFDRGLPDEHAAVLMHLAERAPLAMVVHSGGKSLHGWFYCKGCDPEALKSFSTYAVKLGADPATFNPCQLVRMPGGVRENGKDQKILFLNPEVIQ